MATLSDLFKEKKRDLPSVSERKKLYSSYKLDGDYKGTVEQNVKLAKEIEKDDKLFKDYLGAKETKTKTQGMSIAESKKPELKESKMLKDIISRERLEKVLPKSEKQLKDIIADSATTVSNTIKETKKIADRSPESTKKFLERFNIDLSPTLAKTLRKVSIGIAPTMPFKLLNEAKEKKILEQKEIEAKTIIPTLKDIKEGTYDLKLSEDEKRLVEPFEFEKIRKSERPFDVPVFEVKSETPAIVKSDKFEKKLKDIKKTKDSDIKEKEEPFGPEVGLAKLRSTLSKFADINKELEKEGKSVVIDENMNEIIGIENLVSGKTTTFDELNAMKELYDENNEKLAELEEKGGAHIKKVNQLQSEIANANDKLIQNTEERNKALFEILSSPDFTRDSELMLTIDSVFPNRNTLMLGVSKSPEELLSSNEEISVLKKEMDAILKSGMDKIIDRSIELEHNEAKLSEFFRNLTDKQYKDYQRLMEISKIIGEKDDLTKLQRTWDLIEQPSFQNALLSRVDKLSSEQRKFLEPLIDIIKLTNKLKEEEKLAEKELKGMSEEYSDLWNKNKQLRESINDTVIAFGDPKKQNTLSNWLIEYGESLEDFKRSILYQELETQKQKSDYLKTYEKARKINTIISSFLNIIPVIPALDRKFVPKDEGGIKLEKIAESQPYFKELWSNFQQLGGVIMPSGPANYFQEGAFYDYRVPKTVGKYLIKGVYNIWNVGMASVQTIARSTLDFSSLASSKIEEEIEDIFLSLHYGPDFNREKLKPKTKLLDGDDDISKAWNEQFDTFVLSNAGDQYIEDSIERKKQDISLERYQDYIEDQAKYLKNLFLEFYHPREYKETIVTKTSKAKDLLPEDFKDVEEEFLAINKLRADAEIPVGSYVYLPTNSHVAPRNLLKPAIRLELGKTSQGRTAMLALDLIGWVKLEPMGVFWSQIGSFTGKLVKAIMPKTYKMFKARKAIKQFSSSVYKMEKFGTDMANFISNGIVRARNFHSYFPSLAKMKAYFRTAKILEKLPPNVASAVTKAAERGEIAQNFLPNLFLSQLKSKFTPTQYERFLGSIKMVFSDPKNIKKSEEAIWALFNIFQKDGYKLLKKIQKTQVSKKAGPGLVKVKNPQNVFMDEFINMVGKVHENTLRDYLIFKKFNKLHAKLSEKELNIVSNLWGKRESEINAVLKELSQSKKIPFLKRDIFHKEFSSRSIKKMREAITEFRKRADDLKKVTQSGKSVANFPSGMEVITNTKISNYYDPTVNKFFLNETIENGIPGFLQEVNRGLAKSIVETLDKSRAYSSLIEFPKSFTINTVSELKKFYNEGHKSLLFDALRNPDFTLKTLNGKSVSTKVFKKLRILIRDFRLIQKWLEDWKKVNKSKPIIKTTISVRNERETNLLNAFFDFYKFDLDYSKWPGIDKQNFNSILGKISEFDDSFKNVEKKVSKDTFIPVQYKLEAGPEAFITGVAQNTESILKNVGISDKRVTVVDPRAFKIYLQESISLYYFKKFNPPEVFHQYITELMDKPIHLLTPLEKVDKLILHATASGKNLFPEEISSILEKIALDNPKELKTTLEEFLKKRTKSAKEGLVKWESSLEQKAKSEVVLDMQNKVKDTYKSFQIDPKDELSSKLNPFKNMEFDISDFSGEVELLQHLTRNFIKYDSQKKFISNKFLLRLQKGPYVPKRGRTEKEKFELFHPIQVEGMDSLADIIKGKKSLDKKLDNIGDLKNDVESSLARSYTFFPPSNKSDFKKRISEILENRNKIGKVYIPFNIANSKEVYEQLYKVLGSKVILIKPDKTKTGAKVQKLEFTKKQFADHLNKVGKKEWFTLGGAIPEDRIVDFWKLIDANFRRINISSGLKKTKGLIFDPYRIKILREGLSNFYSSIKESPSLKNLMEIIEKSSPEDFTNFIVLLESHRKSLNEIFNAYPNARIYNKGDKIVFYAPAENLYLNTVLFKSDGKYIGDPSKSELRALKSYSNSNRAKDLTENSSWPKNLDYNNLLDNFNTAFNLSKFGNEETFVEYFKSITTKGGIRKKDQLLKNLNIPDVLATTKMQDIFFGHLSPLKHKGMSIGDLISSEKIKINSKIDGIESVLRRIKDLKEKTIYLKKNVLDSDSLNVIKKYKSVEKQLRIKLELDNKVLPNELIEDTYLISRFLNSKILKSPVDGAKEVSVKKLKDIFGKALDSQKKYLGEVEAIESILKLPLKEITNNTEDLARLIWKLSHKDPNMKALTVVNNFRTDMLRKSGIDGKINLKKIEFSNTKPKTKIKALPNKKLSEFIQLHQVKKPKYPLAISGDASISGLREIKTDLAIFIDVDKETVKKLRRGYKNVLNIKSREILAKGLDIVTNTEIKTLNKFRDGFFKDKQVVFIGNNAQEVMARIISLMPDSELLTYKGTKIIKELLEKGDPSRSIETYFARRRMINVPLSEEERKLLKGILTKKTYNDLIKIYENSIPRVPSEIPVRTAIRETDNLINAFRKKMDEWDLTEFWSKITKEKINRKGNHVLVTLPMSTFNDVDALRLLQDSGYILILASKQPNFIVSQYKTANIKFTKLKPSEIAKLKEKGELLLYHKSLDDKNNIYQKIINLKKETTDSILKEVKGVIKEYRKSMPYTSVSRGELQTNPEEWIKSLYKKRGKTEVTKEWKRELAKFRKEYEEEIRKRILKQFGTTTTKETKNIIEYMMGEFDSFIKSAEKILLGFDKKTGIFLKIFNLLKGAINAGYDWIGSRREGIPLNPLEKSAFFALRGAEIFLNNVKGVITIPFKTLRTMWIWSVLFLRPAWHINNQIGDTFRMWMGSRDLKLFTDSFRIFGITTLAHIRFLVRDTGALFYPIANRIIPKGLQKLLKIRDPLAAYSKGMAKKIQKLKPSTIKDTVKLKAILKNYDITFNPKTLRLTFETYFKKSKGAKLFNKITKNSYWKRNYKMSPSNVHHASGLGLLTALEDPVLVALQYKLLKETGFLSAIKKRASLFKLDLMLYANMMEKTRRMLFLDHMLKSKALSLARASMKTREFLFNYSHLSKAERVLRLFTPFWSFARFSVELYTKELLRLGPKFYWAGRYLLEMMDEACKDLPDQFQDRLKVPFTKYFVYLPLGVIDYFRFMSDPKGSIAKFLDNPQQLPFGLGWDPLTGVGLKLATQKEWYETSRILKKSQGWTQEELEEEMKRNDIPKFNGLKDLPSMLVSYFPQFDLIKFFGAGIFPELFQMDRSILEDELSITGTKVLRDLFKFFGFNVMKVEPWMEFSNAYNNTAPHLRSYLLKKVKEENPAAYEAWEKMLAKAKILACLKAKGDEERSVAYHELLKFIAVSTYYKLEDEKKGRGIRWLESESQRGNNNPKLLLEEHWEFDVRNSVYNREQEARAAKIEAKRYLKEVQKELEEISPTQSAAMDVLGIEHPNVGAAEEFEKIAFDGYGNPKFNTIEEAIQRVEKLKEDYEIPNLVTDVIRDRMRQQSIEWKLLSWEAKQEKRKEDADYYASLGVAFSKLPDNLDELSKEDQRKAWNTFNNYIENKLSEEHRQRYKESNPEYIINLNEKLSEAYKKIGDIINIVRKDPYEKNYYVEFQKLPEWIKEVHYVYKPKDRDLIPFKANLFELQQEDRKQHLLGYKSDSYESYFFSNEPSAVKGREAMDPKDLEFRKYSKKLSERVNQNYKIGSVYGYYSLFETMPQWWKDYYWKQKKDSVESGWLSKEDYEYSKKWFEFNTELEKARIKDKRNLEEGKITNYEKQVWLNSKWDDVKKWKEKYNEMYNGYTDYYRAKFEFDKKSETEGYQNFYNFILNLPEESRMYYFRHHLDSIKYVKFLAKYNELLNETDDSYREEDQINLASEFFWSDKNKEARQAYFKAYPLERYYIQYRERLFEMSKDAGEYYSLILKAPEKFQRIYFRKHPLAKFYLPEIQKYFKAMDEDSKLESQGVTSNKARKIFETKSFQKALNIWDKTNRGVKDYYTGWYEISKEVDKQGIDNWGKIYEEYVKSHPGFRKELIKRQPDKYYILYPFRIELSKLEGKEAKEFFFNSANEKARQLMEKEDPGIVSYYKFWFSLSDMAEKGHWNRYFNYYFSDQNKTNRLRHWENNPEAEKIYPLWRKYQLMPASYWEERKAKNSFLDNHPELKKFFEKDLTSSEYELRKKVSDYFDIKMDFPAEGKSKEYFFTWEKKRIQAEKYLEKHPEVASYLQDHSKKYGDEQSGKLQMLSDQYYNLSSWEEKDKFLDKHPELREFLVRFSPPGIRDVIKLQTQYFNISEDNWDAKNRFLKKHPELKDYWEVKSYPEIFFTNSNIREKYLAIDSKVKEFYNIIKSPDWAAGEKIRQQLPAFYTNPGIGKIADWFKDNIYREAMSAWSSLLERNRVAGIMFFRQLPVWIQDRYLKKNPQYSILRQYPIERFMEEPFRKDINSQSKLKLHLAQKLHYKYTPNLPEEIKDKVRKEFIRAGIWESRANWSKLDWQRYYFKRAIEKNRLYERDVRNNPLLRKEAERLSKVWLTRGRLSPFKKRVVPRVVKIKY